VGIECLYKACLSAITDGGLFRDTGVHERGENERLSENLIHVGRCGVVGSTLAFGSIGHGFESEHHLFSHHGASAFSKLRSLAKCSLDDSVRRLL